LLLLIMNYNHPFTTNARIYFAVTPVLPGVKGRVIEVPVQANTPLKEADVLFRVDPKPYEYIVEQKKAALAEAEQNVKQMKASLEQATAIAEKANAQFELAQQNYDRQAELFEKRVIAQATLDTFTRNLETARQSLAGARAEEERARLAYSSNFQGVNPLSPACAPSWTMPSTILSKPWRERRAQDSSARWPCGRACTSSRRRCGRSWCSSTPRRGIGNSGRRSSKIPCSA